jgi:hypothetical protein
MFYGLINNARLAKGAIKGGIHVQLDLEFPH